MRGSYSGNTLAFQAKARSSILLPRSTQFAWIAQGESVSFTRRGSAVRNRVQVPSNLGMVKWYH